MLRKFCLFVICILIFICGFSLYHIYNIDHDELNFYYSIKKDNLKIYSPDDEYIGEYNCSKECYLSYSLAENLLDNIIITDEVKKPIQVTIPVIGDYAFITDDQIVNLVNLKNNEVIDTYHSIKYLNDDYVALKNFENMYAIVNISDDEINFISDFQYEYVGISDYSKNFLVKNDYYYLVNIENNKVSELFETIYNYGDNEIIVKDNGYYYLYDYTGEKTLPNGYTMIKLDNDFLYLVSNNLLQVYNKNYDLLNADAINLGVIINWTSYYVYSSQYEFLYESSVFTKTYEGNVLTINANNNLYEISVN